MKETIFDKLASSRDDAKSAADIAKEVGLPPRTVYAYIREKRREGIPIISDRGGKGYWIATDAHDIRTWARQSQASAFDMLSTVSMLLSVADEMESDQISMI